MKINRTTIITRLSNSPKLTRGVLWNIIDLFDSPERWWEQLIKNGADSVRAAVVRHAIQECGLALTLRTVADCYRYHIA